MFQRQLTLIDRHWRALAVLAWALFAAWLIYDRWHSITGFILSDTDDNMRMSQVRAWLNEGQGWFDLRNYHLDWPNGANIHWSRLVDLPIAGLILLGRLFMSGPHAEQMAVAVAPLIPFLVLIFALALTVRRLVHPAAWPLAVICLFFAGSATAQYVPTRIDHHGWQLAFLALGMAGIADPKRARGGLMLGLASALSLAIGLESIIYIALSGVAMVAFWATDAGERRRLATYAASLVAGTAFSYLVFASYDNRLAVCDALSPVWLSDAMVGGALMLGLAWWSPAKWQARVGGALVAGAVIAGFHALTWPHCLSRLEGVSPEVTKLWLSHVREARPVYRHGWRIASVILSLPIAGLIGWGALAWRHRADPDLFRRTLGAAAAGLAAFLLLFWQVRTAPASQVLAIPGAVTLVALLAPIAFRSDKPVIRVIGTTLAVLAGLGALVPLVVDAVAPTPVTPRDRQIARANDSCPSMWAMRPIALLPRATIFTFADLAPRLITVTHHRSIAGPYHRNGPAIVDSMMTFRGTPDQAHALLLKYHSDYLLTCPMMSQATIYTSETPNGFYAQLEKGHVPAWLEPVPLGKDWPLKLYRVRS